MAIDPTQVKAVLFDVDGTLRDTDDELISKLAGLARPALGEDRARRVMRGVVMTAEAPVQVLLGLADRVGWDGPLNRLIDALAPHGDTHLMAGAGDMISGLVGRYRLGVVSAGPQRSVDRFLDQHGLRTVMEVVVTGQTFSRTKPHPMPVIEAARRLGVEPHEALMVGDTTVDIKAGRRAGAQTLGVLSGFGRRGDLERELADQITGDVTALQDLLPVP